MTLYEYAQSNGVNTGFDHRAVPGTWFSEASRIYGTNQWAHSGRIVFADCPSVRATRYTTI